MEIDYKKWNGRVIIHVGYHKTASTYFQKVVYPNVSGFKFIERDLVKKSIILPHDFSWSPEQTISALGCPKDTDIILCEEVLSGNLFTSGFSGYQTKVVAERLAEVFPSAQINIVIRSQLDMLVSIYCQYVKQGGSYCATEFFGLNEDSLGNTRTRGASPIYNLSHVNYDKMVELYRRLFGEDNVFVHFYENMKSDRPAFLSKVMEVNGISFRKSGVGANSNKKENESYGLHLLGFARLVNLFHSSLAGNKRILAAIPFLHQKTRMIFEFIQARNWGGRKVMIEDIFNAKQIERLEDFYAESNARLAKLISIDKAELRNMGYPITVAKSG